MDAQLKKEFWKFACSRSSAGRLIWLPDREGSGGLREASSRRLHILKRHEALWYVRAESVEHGGRLRRVYAITDAGRQRLEEFKDEWREAAKAFEFIERAAGGHDQV